MHYAVGRYGMFSFILCLFNPARPATFVSKVIDQFEVAVPAPDGSPNTGYVLLTKIRSKQLGIACVRFYTYNVSTREMSRKIQGR